MSRFSDVSVTGYGTETRLSKVVPACELMALPEGAQEAPPGVPKRICSQSRPIESPRMASIGASGATGPAYFFPEPRGT